MNNRNVAANKKRSPAAKGGKNASVKQVKKTVRGAMDPGKKIVRFKSGVDRPFLFILLLLLCIGTVMVFSASYPYAKENLNNSYYFAIRQVAWAVLGILICTVVMSNVDYLLVRKYGKLFFAVSMLLMILVLFIGEDNKGAKRWINLGPVNIQPSEIAKLAIVLFFAEYIIEHKDDMKSFKKGALPFFAVAAYLMLMMFLQPHISGMIIILALIFVMMFFGGVSMKILGALGGTALVGVAGLIFISDHARQRIDVWLHPFENIQGEGWQPMQSLYAIGSGGLWGVGLGQSRQKHLYLPEPQNDYIFSILCEEMGFIFAIAVLILFVALIWRGFYIAKNAPSNYASLVVIGIMSHVAIQVLLNLAVVTNTIPSTGISLPFFSYGGSSLMFLMAEMGIVLNISRYSYLEKG